ncbi:hypothetical protein PF011_g3262 [Phytophthora fragariae]|uniref:C2 domain-containing protein n=1 Tax=Phytophthora fragariae TaxID=53985 RepID=A0A6A3M052_9STRA|nr:hypothetical protein PF011_g3262 [Phytophthora fragariae]
MEKASEPSEKEALAKKALQAIRAGNGEELKEVLRAGADPNVAPTSGIKNDESLVNILLDQDANANGSKAVGLPPLRAAVVRNNAVLIKLLLSRGANVNHRYSVVTGKRKETKTVLFETATSSTYELLLQNGADVSMKNSWHETPLHFQAYNWNSRLVRALIASGADVNAVNKKNTTPLDNALFRKPSQRKSDDEEFMEVCRILLRSKATVSWSDPEEYFQLKGKPDSDLIAIKARLQLVHEWNSQRKKGNTSFKLPIEVFRRGAPDIVTYYSALNRGGRSRGSMVRKPEPRAILKAIEEPATSQQEYMCAARNDEDRHETEDDQLHVDAQSLDFDLASLWSFAPSPLRALNHKQSNHKDAMLAYSAPPTSSQPIHGPEVKGRRSEQPVQYHQSEPSYMQVIGGSNTSLKQDVGTGEVVYVDPETSPMRPPRVIRKKRVRPEVRSIPPVWKVKAAERPESGSQLYRSKVCVVGPSRWGKTSFIKSFISGAATLESFDVRTIGIDLFPWSFEVETEAGDCEYQVSFWDFAGQEEYRAAHTLFYSSRTLYLLCINLERYHNALAAATDSTDQTVDDRMMDAFAEVHVFRWVRMICAHHPQAEFVFLGTKADRVGHDRRKITAVQQDIFYRFKANTRRMKDRVQRALQELEDAKFEIQDSNPAAETTELDDQISSCEQILRKQPVLLSEELIVFSSADMKDESIARGKLKALLMMSGSSVLLPPSYAELLKYAQQCCVHDQKNKPSFQDKVDAAFVSVTEFAKLVTNSSELTIPEGEMLAALHLLHDTGDIVWFDGVSDVRVLQERLFLDPMLVIEFIRQIVNHKLDASTAVNGYVSHALLQSLPFWREVSTTTMQQLKELLLHLHLAYSSGKSKRMVWNSDLIVPVYWNRVPETTVSDTKTFPSDEDKSAGLVEFVRWEYSFEPAIPENLFEKLAVATYSPLLPSERHYAGSSFIDNIANEFSSRIAKENDDANSVLSVSVVARERTLAWKQLVWDCMNLENLLKTYPGLLVTRCTVSQRDQRFNVDQLLSDQEHFTQLSIGTDQKYLPADMGWYTNKSRQLNPVTDPAKSQTAAGASNESALSAQVAHLQQGIDDLATIMGQQSDSMERRFQQNAEHIDAIAKEIQRSQIALITGMKNKAQFPSLWTLEYQQPEKASDGGGIGSGIISSLKRKVMTTVVLKFRSELSGQCHHDPITISVAPELLSRYGKFLKTGLTLLSAATPDFCGKYVLGIITDECKRQLDRSMDFHEVLHRAGVSKDPTAGPHNMENNRELSPNEILTLLSCLLRVHNEAFRIEDIPQLSGLVSGVVVNPTEYIWASRDEILQHGHDIMLAVGYSRRGEANPLNSIEDTVVAQVNVPVEPFPPVPTETLPLVVPIPPQHGLPIDVSSKLASREDNVGPKGVLQAMRRRLSSSKSSVPTTEVQRFMLKIVGAKGLHVSKKQSPYCICRFDTSNGVTLLQVQTTPHTNGGQNPSWKTQLFEVALPIDAAAIMFTVKYGNTVGSTQLAQGSTSFVSLKPGQSTTQEVCLVKNNKPAGSLQVYLEAFA